MRCSQHVLNLTQPYKRYIIYGPPLAAGGKLSLASCLIYARAFVEYAYGCVLFQDVTVREIRGR